ncbi:MAG TPA: ArdC-like ssDNA-binding domain-containing protein [Candidatus Angelobacter sp.]|nr:ArdC-like ssDNA-binding domain-containing protein [Candidatus Angelobacter sp.]
MFSTNNSNSKGKTTQELVTASIESLVKALESGHSEALSSYLQAMAHFHTYSLNNILLIAAQKPSATRVAGIRTWNELGRRVKRGEKGILIFAPLIGYKRSHSSEPESSGRRKKGKTDESAQAGIQTERQLLGFRGVYVFDVAQTEGDELPELGNTVQGDVSEILPRLIEFVQSRQIKFEYSEKISPARGMSCGGLIRLLPGMEPTETLATLVHELAHEMLHKGERRTLVTKTVRETEAEAVAFVVLNALGLETGSGSADYIQLYHGDAKLLQESLEVVQRTSAVILGAISPRDAAEPTTAVSGVVMQQASRPEAQEVRQ